MADKEALALELHRKIEPKLRYTTFTETICDRKEDNKENLSLQEAFRLYREAKQVGFHVIFLPCYFQFHFKHGRQLAVIFFVID